ncbi:uncharacterized protein LOC132097348 isoform X6 [Carassius carassius]|uniref:uncharacterized protein LOC132097348 isoform X6 n=1 Tax=Carassius carassius TaxID=217509 RepID=UPI0028689C7E|nr:uncharacterized protein LOC132097348 isoform X6 [Carassius carassius]
MVFVKEENTTQPETCRIKHEEPEPRRIKHEEPETCRIKQEPETWRIKHEEQGASAPSSCSTTASDVTDGLMKVEEERRDLNEVDKLWDQKDLDVNEENL